MYYFFVRLQLSNVDLQIIRASFHGHGSRLQRKEPFFYSSLPKPSITLGRLGHRILLLVSLVAWQAVWPKHMLQWASVHV